MTELRKDIMEYLKKQSEKYNQKFELSRPLNVYSKADGSSYIIYKGTRYSLDLFVAVGGVWGSPIDDISFEDLLGSNCVAHGIHCTSYSSALEIFTDLEYAYIAYTYC